jgi:hypothetical protein
LPNKYTTAVPDVSQLRGLKLLDRFREIFAGLDARRTKSPREPDAVYVGDRNYSGDYGLLERMDEIGASFVVRLQDKSVIKEIEKIPVSEKDRKIQR